MNHFRWQAVVGLAFVLAAATDVFAQKEPHIGFLYPSGGQQGTTFEMTVGGQFLREVDEVYATGRGVQAKVVKYFRHLSDQQYNGLRMRATFYTRERLDQEAKAKGLPPKKYTVEELIKLTKYTEEELAQMEDYKKRGEDKKRQFNPQLLEEVTLQVTIAKDAPLGDREVRLISPLGLSNPLFFQVGNVREVRETETGETKGANNNKTPDALVGDKLPVVINGQIMPGDVDRFSFKAKKGTKLVIAASVRALIPYLADAVPGWFQAVMSLHDAEGNELTYADSLGFRQDPVIYYEVPKDGEYFIQIWDAIYRGREDFVYRIAMGELPFITSIFPLGGRAGTKVEVSLTGWNLPVDRVPIDATYDRKRPVRSFTVRKGDLVSNRIHVPIDMVTEMMEKEPNDAPEQAQEVPSMPIIINGRIDKPGDVDVFRFEGHAAQHIIAEVYARRLGSPLDSLVRLTDAEGKEIAVSDDYEDKGTPLLTHHADSRLAGNLQASGTHYIRVMDAQRRGGPDYGYRLYIRQPRPDFELRVVPSSIVAKPGACAVITVHALRRDGFTGEIPLQLEDAPPGFTLQGAVIPANQDKVRMTLMVPPKPTKEPIALELGAEVVLRGGRKLSHIAVPAEDWMQAFAYRHLVPAKEWTVSVSGKGVFRPPLRYGKEERVKLPNNGAPTRLVFFPTAKQNVQDIRLELSEPMDGVAIQSQTAEEGSVTVVMTVDGKKVKAGVSGNLIFLAFREYIPMTSEGKPRPPQRSLISPLPAVSAEVVAAKETKTVSKETKR